MTTDPELLNADEDSVEFWAMVHVWYALGQLKVTDAIAPLLDLREIPIRPNIRSRIS